MATNNQIIYRDAFLGDIQDKARVLEQIRFPLVVKVSEADGTTTLSAIKELLRIIYCDHGTINLIAQSENKLMLMFSDDRDALIAYEDLHNTSVQDRGGSIISFKIWHPVDDLGYDVADHHIYIAVQGLPQHLWKREVVEQILHPYCALGELSDETLKRTNLCSFTTFACTQQRITIPRKISLKVVKESTKNSSLKIKSNSKQVFIYTLIIDAVGYLCGQMTHCSCNLENLNTRYESTYDPDNSQCFLAELPDNRDLLEELQFAVVAMPSNDHHGCQNEDMQSMVSGYVGSPVKVHRLDSKHLMILPSNKFTAHTTKSKLMDIKFLTIDSARFTLDGWNSSIMSTTETLSVKVSVSMTEVPAHLCTPKLIKFILSPYCAADTEERQPQIMPTSEKYNCTAWTNTPSDIPKRIMAALFARSPRQESCTSIDLMITQMFVDATAIQSSSTYKAG